MMARAPGTIVGMSLDSYFSNIEEDVLRDALKALAEDEEDLAAVREAEAEFHLAK